MEVNSMKKLKINFWYWFYYLGSFLYQLGDQMESKGLDKLDELDRSDPNFVRKYRKKRGWGP